MATIPKSIEVEFIPESQGRPEAPVGPLVAGLRDAVLKRVRVLAWRVLDLETEFEALD